MAGMGMLSGGNVESRGLEEEMRSSYLDYAMSVIVGRALPDVRDGLKPVHRRVLYAMHESGLGPTRPYKKSAATVGEVMAKFHPHGDSAIYDTLVRLAQDFAMREPLVDGQGNFGSIDNDSAAAMRYCVSGDTRVATTEGTLRIDSLVPGAEPESDSDVELHVLDRRGVPTRASTLLHSGDHPTKRLRARGGYELTGTHNHPVLCLVEIVGVPMLLWKLLEEIHPGDRVVMARDVHGPVIDGLAEHDRRTAMSAVTAASRAKHVPELVWGGTPAFKRAFLQALFSGGGSSSLLPRNTIRISYSTYSEQLARDVQTLLLEFGVVSRICRYAEDELKIVVTNRRDARLFAKRIGFLGKKQEKLARDLATIPESSRAPSRDHVPFLARYIRAESGASGSDEDWLRRHNIDRIDRWEQGGTAILERIASEEVRAVTAPLVTGEFFYAEVESVTDAGVQPVYSLRVESEDHSFLTNGFVSHNTEARLARLATEMLRDIDADTVDFTPTYDDAGLEPSVLPARFPNLLVNGSSGIAVGMATNIPPQNLGEVVDGVVAFIDNPDIDVAGLMKYIKGPDFPTGGVIKGWQGIKDAYETGRGRVVVQGRAHTEDIGRGKEAIIVTELPYQVSKGDGRNDGSGLIKKIAEVVQNGRIPQISDLRDESGKAGIRLVIELKRDALPKVVLNNLFKFTPLQSTFGVNTVALVDGVPRTLSLRELIREYVQHQRDVVVRRTKHELRQREARLHILEGLLIAITDIDAVIKLIRGSADPDAARDGLMDRFDLTRIQAQAILDLRLQRLTALEANKLRDERDEVVERIGELRAILGDEQRVRDIIKEELLEIRHAYANDRRTEITHSEDDIDIEDLIADQQMVISITRSGYIKSLPLATYRKQHRGGVGVMGMDMKDDDFIEHLFVCSTHDYLLFFTNRGKVYRQKVYELPEASRTAKGRALVNVLPLRDGEFVRAVISTRDFTEGRYLVFATRQGQIKKTEFLAYNTPIKADGIIAIKIRDDDELVAVRRTGGEDDIIMVARSGQAARFSEADARPMGRDTAGVRGMNVARGDNAVLSMDVVQPDTELLVVTENGFGKRTPIEEYPVKGRGAMGVKTIGLTERKGAVAAALIVRDHQDLLFISQGGMVQRTGVRGISQQGRPAQGVNLMNLRADDQVSAVALLMEEETAAAAGTADVEFADLTADGSATAVADALPEPAEEEPEVDPGE